MYQISDSEFRCFPDWLVQLRSQGASGFDTEFAVLLEKAMHHKSGMRGVLAFSKVDGSSKDALIDRSTGGEGRGHRDLEMTDSTTDAAGISCCSPDFDPCRKRKAVKDDDVIRAKLLKCHIHDSPIKNFSPLQNDVGLVRRN